VHVINDLSYSYYFVGRPKRQALKDDPHQVKKMDQVDQINQVDVEMLSKQQEDKCQGEFLLYLMADDRSCLAFFYKKRVKGHPGPTEGSLSMYRSPGTDRREP
jgi:hypothetical protein